MTLPVENQHHNNSMELWALYLTPKPGLARYGAYVWNETLYQYLCGDVLGGLVANDG